jgi:glycosyltransferase involved in cell wall biosynthesis
MPLFSVIVPTYNRPDFLEEALKSVERQTFDDFECIVVEDSPPQPTAIVPEDARFRLIRHSRNQGVGAARNTGIRHASGLYISFLDDDDVYTPDRLETSFESLRTDCVTVCARGNLDGSLAHQRRFRGNVANTILNGFTPHLGQATIPRLLSPEFNERYLACQDIEWWLRVAQTLPVQSASHVGYLMRTHTNERHGNGRTTRADFSRRLLEDYAEYFRVHRRARAFRLERLARLEASLGRRVEARSAAWRSVWAFAHPRALALALTLSANPRNLKGRPGGGSSP